MGSLRDEDLFELGRVVNHDLRSAIRHIREFYQILHGSVADKFTEDDTEIHQFIDSSINSAFAQTTAIAEYLKTAGRPVQVNPVDIHVLVDTTLTDLGLNPEQSAALIMTIESPPLVHSDPYLLGLILKALLSNAFLFHKKDGDLRVSLEISYVDDHLTIKCSDNGIGIEGRQVDTIFKPFKRLNHKDEFPGVGIGLTMTKIAVDKLKGEISVSSCVKKQHQGSIKKTDTTVTEGRASHGASTAITVQIPCCTTTDSAKKLNDALQS